MPARLKFSPKTAGTVGCAGGARRSRRPVLGGISVDRFFGAAVDPQIGLAVSIDVGGGHRHGLGGDRLLADTAFDHMTAPLAEIAGRATFTEQEMVERRS